jgi:hypothetical protein
MFECKFEAAVVSAVQAVLAAEDIVSLDDVADFLDEARTRPRAARPLFARVHGWSAQGLMATLKLRSTAHRNKLDKCRRTLAASAGAAQRAGGEL